MSSKQFNTLYKFLLALAHIWDMHEIGLVKRERMLQDLLQEARNEHDVQNQRREEKLDLILDQMRESSSEKDLKRLLTNVNMQLDAIKKGYQTFHDSQIDIVNTYPEMVSEELKKYKSALYKLFSIKQEQPQQQQLRRSTESLATNGGGEEANVSFESAKEVLTSETGVKYYVVSHLTSSEKGSKSNEDEATTMNETAASVTNEILAYEDQMPNTKAEFIEKMRAESYLKQTFISFDFLNEAKQM